MIKKTNLILILFSTIFILSCSDNKPEPSNNPNFKISQTIKDLIYSIGNESAPTVVVNTQGGPMPELATTMLKDHLNKINKTNLLIVNVHQAQTLKPSLFTNNDITFKQAIDYDAQSIETLYKVVKYFKDQGRKVYVLGVSFGAFMTQELIHQKGIDAADKYLIMVGRLDINAKYWQGFSRGKTGRFVDGITPIIEDETGGVVAQNMNKLAAGLGRNRYTQLFKDLDLSKVTYFYGKTDEEVGKLTDAEIQFLKSKGANVIAKDGGHQDTSSPDNLVLGFKEAFGIK